METIFLLCAVAGGGVLAVQLVLSFLGFGADLHGDPGDLASVDVDIPIGAHDAGGHAHAHAHPGLPGIVKFLSFQTIVAFVAFFGVGGMATLSAGQSHPVAVIVALLAGAGAMFVLGYLMQSFRKLEASGSLRLDRAVGCQGRVYLRIPGECAGEGKVTITVQGRAVELNAKTAGKELLTGATVVVTRILEGETVEVSSVEESPVATDASRMTA